MSRPVDDPEVLDQMQDEIISLLRAWEDRGATPSEAGQVLLANANLVMLKFGVRFGEVVRLAAHQWEKHGGRY